MGDKPGDGVFVIDPDTFHLDTRHFSDYLAMLDTEQSDRQDALNVAHAQRAGSEIADLPGIRQTLAPVRWSPGNRRRIDRRSRHDRLPGEVRPLVASGGVPVIEHIVDGSAASPSGGAGSRPRH